MSETTSGQASTDTATAAAAPAPAAAPAAPAPAASAEAPAPAPAAATQAAAPASATPEPAAPVVGAPEKYEFKPTEGIKLGEKIIGKYSEIAKELNLTQDGAQKVLTEIAPLIAQQQADVFKSTREAWVNEAKGDKEIGGDKFNENLALAKKGAGAYFSKEFVALLDQTGLGDHPEMIRGLMKIGKTVKEDTLVTGGQGGSPLESIASKLYPNH